MRVDDHRELGQRLDLFHLQEEAPGMVFWHPAGLSLCRALEDAARRHVAAEGYREVRTPQLLDQRIWEKSGHWEHFRDGMFLVGDGAALKPVSCPGHAQIFLRANPSYRDLPIRLSELGLCHRNEASGALSGLLRLRQFTQDDGHVFCAEEQVVEEVARFCAGLVRFYPALGFAAPRVFLATRPESRAGDEATWDRAEAALAEAARVAGLDPAPNPGGGAFYGPKLEFSLDDRSGRTWQLGTIQVDMIQPARFDLGYTAAGGAQRRPVMLHRAIYGSVERFLAVLLEHHGVALPAWLAPEQARIAPLQGGAASAAALRDRLRAAGVRAEIDGDEKTLAWRVRDAHERGVPYLLVLGARELERGTVSVRPVRGGPAREQPVDEAIASLAQACAPPL